MSEQDQAPREPGVSPSEAETGKRPKKDWKAELIDWIKSIIWAVAVAVVVFNLLFTLIRVQGNSMADTLVSGERIFVTILDVKLNGVARGDVVICHYPNRGRTFFVKRLVGLPGDRLERVGGETFVTYADGDGNAVRESLGVYIDSTGDYGPYTLGENEFFVVGDNRFVSHDSRDWNDSDPSNDVGPISGNMIVGRARYVVWPPNKAREVK